MEFKHLLDQVARHPNNPETKNRRGYHGKIIARGKPYEVVNGQIKHAKAKGIFIEKGGAVVGRDGKVVGHIVDGKLHKLAESKPIEGRETGGPVIPGKPYVVGEAGPEVIVPKVPGVVLAQADAMDPRAQAKYKEATGEAINSGRDKAAAEAIRTDQGVTPIPPNVRGLAELLVKTGRAAPDKALDMAISMTQRPK